VAHDRFMSSSPKTVLAGALALLALAIAAPAASADSIAYVKSGDIYLSTADGGRQYRVTTTGGYSDVSQADDGTMIGLHGVRLHRLSRTGRVLADFDTPVSDTRPAPSKTFYGPYDPAISPDGKKVAYTYYYMTQSQNPTCFPPECVTTINEGGTGYSWADRQTGWDDPKLGKHSGWRNPSWVDDDTVMISDPTHAFNYDVILDTISDGDSGNLVHGWFSDLAEGNPHVSGGDISRDRRKLAFVTGEGDSTLTLYGVPSFPTTFRDGDAPVSTRPLICYRYSGPRGGSFSTPTFAPDGNRVAWAEADGIKVVSVPSFANGCTTTGASPNAALLIPGGKNPDWGPAGVPAGSGAAAGGLAVKSADAKLRRALAKGLTMRVRTPGAGRLSATATRRGRKVASGAKSVHGTDAAVKLRFTKAARRSLKHARSVKLRINVAFRPAGGAVQRTTVSLRLTR
jgi:WD40 repeat protein